VKASEIKGLDILIGGFPGEKPKDGTLWYDSGKIIKLDTLPPPVGKEFPSRYV